RLLKSCLEKDPKRRLRDVGDAWCLLEQDAPMLKLHPRRYTLPWALAGVLTAALCALLWVWLGTPAAARPPVMRWCVGLPQAGVAYLGLSRDGTRLVYGDGGTSPLFLRMVNQLESRPLTGTEGGRGPAFSPNGQWIAYTVGGTLKKVPVTGGAPITLHD